MSYVRAIAKSPHPTGSAEHTNVRDYVVRELAAQGLEWEVQRTTVLGATVQRRSARPIPAGTMHNIVARLRGTESTRAVALAAHYDSVATGPGATDDGAGVATLLETVRALRSGPPLKNDVILIFTDGEELGLLGARAFVDQHPWMRDVEVVLNFEGRGASGPVYMFETSDENRWLIREFAGAAPHPVANSLMYSVYKLLPNDTDLTIFKRAGLAGLNFAYVDGVHHYHTALDTADELDERSLQHHGSYALSLARRFGQMDLSSPGTRRTPGDAVYFNLFGPLFIHYPETWVVPLSALTALLFGSVFAFGLKRKRLSASGLAYGFFTLLASIVLSGSLVKLWWWAVRRLHPGYESLPWGEPYQINLYKLASVALSVAVASAFYVLARRRASASDLLAGALAVWMLLLALLTVMLPAASYVLMWPLLSSLAGLALSIATGKMAEGDTVTGSRRPRHWWREAALALACAPAILLLAPLVYMLFALVGLGLPVALMALLVLLVGALFSSLDALTAPPRRWLLPATAAVAALTFTIAGLSTARFDAQHRSVNSLFYLLNADTGKAAWATTDAASDEWTSKFIPPDAGRESVQAYVPWITQPLRQSEAPALALAAPQLEVFGDHTEDGVRTLRARVSTAREAGMLLVFTEPSTEVLGAAVNGRELRMSAAPAASGPTPEQTPATNSWKLLYAAPPAEGFELTLSFPESQRPRLTVVDISNTLPKIAAAGFTPRPDHMMPAPGLTSDATLVSRTFAVGP